MLNASEKFWIQSKPVSSCRALLPVLIAFGLNFNLNSPICLTHSLLSSQQLSFCRVLRICLNSAGFLAWQNPVLSVCGCSACSFFPCSTQSAFLMHSLAAQDSPQHALAPGRTALLVEDWVPRLLLLSDKNLYPRASVVVSVCSFMDVFWGSSFLPRTAVSLISELWPSFCSKGQLCLFLR